MATRTREQTVPKEFVHALAKYPPFAALLEDDQRRIARMILEEGSKARAHHSAQGASSYSYQYLNQEFGRGRFNSVNRIANVFVVGSSWSALQGNTRAFSLAPVYRQIKEQYLHDVVMNRRISCLVDMRGRQVRSRLAAIAGKRRNGVTATLWAGVTISPTIPVDTGNLAQLYHRCSDQLKLNSPASCIAARHDVDRYKLIRVRDASAIHLALAHVEGREPGSICVRYSEASSGRLYASGHNLQNCPRVVRHAALDGAWDIDLDNAHYTLLVELAEREGFACPNLRHYIQNKAAFRQELARLLDADVDTVKACLLALIYDAPRSTSRYSTFGRLLGKDKAFYLLSLPLFQALAGETRRAGQHVVANWPSSNRSLVNFAGCGILLAAPRKEKLAHLLQGAEALILKTAVVYLERLCPNNVLLLQHDGLTVRHPIDLDALNTHVRAITDLMVTFESEQIQFSDS